MKRIQNIMSAPSKILISKKKYVTKSILKKVLNKELTEKDALNKYGKLRYRKNTNTMIIKQIKHS